MFKGLTRKGKWETWKEKEAKESEILVSKVTVFIKEKLSDDALKDLPSKMVSIGGMFDE